MEDKQNNIDDNVDPLDGEAVDEQPIDEAAIVDAMLATAGEPQPTVEQEAIAEQEPIAAEPESNLPPHFEPIPAHKIKRAKRTKIILIVIIVLLVAALLALGAAAAYVFFDQQNSVHVVEKTGVEIETTIADDKVQDRGTVQVTEQPNLVQMFGKTSEEVKTQLGSNYSISKTEAIQEQDNPAIKQLATITYSPEDKQSGMAVGTAQTQNIYLSLDEQGKTIEVYFVSSIDLLGYPMATFAELTANKETVVKAISAAGATVAADFAYTAPTVEQFTTYVDPDAKEKKIKKETATFNGNLQSEAMPKSFSLTLTYDYGAAGVANTPDKKPTQRTIYLTLR